MCRGCRLSLRQLPSIHCFGLPGISLTVNGWCPATPTFVQHANMSSPARLDVAVPLYRRCRYRPSTDQFAQSYYIATLK